MLVEVNEKNIDKYNLVELTGNSREDMLSAAAEARINGHNLSCNVPDDQVETENVFDIYESEPVDPRRLQGCGYEEREDNEGNKYQVCLLHGKTSRHDLNVNPNALCLLMDPHPQEVLDAMKTLAEKPAVAPKIGSICTYDKKDSAQDGTTYVCKIHGRPSKHDISRLPNQPCLSVDPYDGFEEVNE
jgi:hypothetical protein